MCARSSILLLILFILWFHSTIFRPPRNFHRQIKSISLIWIQRLFAIPTRRLNKSTRNNKVIQSINRRRHTNNSTRIIACFSKTRRLNAHPRRRIITRNKVTLTNILTNATRNRPLMSNTIIPSLNNLSGRRTDTIISRGTLASNNAKIGLGTNTTRTSLKLPPNRRIGAIPRRPHHPTIKARHLVTIMRHPCFGVQPYHQITIASNNGILFRLFGRGARLFLRGGGAPSPPTNSRNRSARSQFRSIVRSSTTVATLPSGKNIPPESALTRFPLKTTKYV